MIPLKKICFHSLTLLLLLVQQPRVFAILNLELTQGIDSAIPIAIVPFQGDNAAPTNISEIIKSDLKNSGQFNPLDPNAMPQFPSDLKSVNLDDWQALGVDDLVIGSIATTSGHHFDVTFYLLTTYRNQSAYQTVKNTENPNANAVLLKEKFSQIPASNLRALSHHIADLIYQKLTGMSGIFSTRIAYVLVKHDAFGQPIKFSLIIADADGFNPRPILVSPEPILSPDWSPDGQKIAYVSLEQERAAIYISDVATGQRTLLTHFAGINGAPAWSPDGQKIALVLSQDGNPKIFIMDLKTKKLTQITDGWSIDTEPCFSPDGKSLIFTSDRAGGPQIYRIELPNGKINRLTYTGNYNAKASFTPDGKSIVMLHRGDDGNFNIAIQNLDTNDLLTLSHSTDDQSPSISPNGRMVIYASRHGDEGILAMASIDDQVHLDIPATDGEVREPVWGPK